MSIEKMGYVPPIVNYRETIRFGKTELVNFSTISIGEAINYFPKNLNAEKIVLMPDLNPGRAPLPSGCSVEFDEAKQPDWRKLTISDIGCGMQLLKSNLKWHDFDRNLKAWNRVYSDIKNSKGKQGDLGSGNHFLDAAVNDKEDLYFVIHTGSRNESVKVEKYLDNPYKFDMAYQDTQNWARGNRDKVREFLMREYGELELLFDKPHNFYNRINDKVVIYKGAVSLMPQELSLIPSSMDGDMVIVEGKKGLEKINYTMAHGTGRIKSRSQTREERLDYDFENLRKRIYIPNDIKNEAIFTENPTCYRDLDDCMIHLGDLVNVKSKLHPIAYIGQI